MAATAVLLLSLSLFSLLSHSSALPPQRVLNAAEVLSDSGFISMALTLQLVSDSLIPSSSSSSSAAATIFAPSDAAFSRSGQPPLSLLQLHSSPLTFSPRGLRSLPFGTPIPTMLPRRPLFSTTLPSDPLVSLNNVTFDASSPIFDDGSLAIFAVDRFFDPNFNVSAAYPRVRSPGSNSLGCRSTDPAWSGPRHAFNETSAALRAKGYSAMAAFLDLQLLGFKNLTKWTVLAPIDGAIAGLVGNSGEQASLFHRHVLPCKLSWADLVLLGNGTALRTSLEGFTVAVSRSRDDVLMLNEVAVVSPDIFNSDWVVVHGLGEVLSAPAEQARVMAENEDGEEWALERQEF